MLGLAADLAKSSPNAVILVVVADIRSALGNQLTHHEDFSPIDRSNVIISALFRDAGTAAIITSAPSPTQMTPSLPEYEIVDHVSCLLPNTRHLALYQEFDDSELHLFLDRKLPDAIFESITGLVEPMLKPHGITPQQCHYFSHTGGPKILRGVASTFGVPEERLASSWHIMKNYGNLSGSSNISVLDHSRRSGERIDWAICAAFGPGISVELTLLRRVCTVPESLS
jgi:predicted naringenin-chalcone synthase